ncbi:hypothetical protein [Streptococcus equinus]|uniref:Uncharacterized protein n=1 Tax=Streptococcus equinus TaxID=1335 RepID=A0A1G9IDI8_STREI|nr:hypothetical protein [Streptococcus equinus]SDL23277.1 hypothetical protein SAMN05216400_0145 [Streptococcus equinus]
MANTAKNVGASVWNHFGEIAVGTLVGGFVGGAISLVVENNEVSNNER